MKRLLINTLTLVLSLFCLQATAMPEPANLGLLLQKVIKYHDSGQYQRDIAAQISDAKRFLVKRVQRFNPAKDFDQLTIVFDIDETVLSNYPYMRKVNFGYNPKMFAAHIQNDTDPVIKPSLELYNYAKQHKVAVYFITGRTEDWRAETLANLHHAGFKNWDGLIMRPTTYKNRSIIPFKAAARRQLINNNHHIVLNIGDQKSDLAEGLADKSVKLPNPYYFLP